jgi:hypothetical protein
MTEAQERQPDLVELRELHAKATEGPWHATNHFADDSTPCNCAYILSDGYAGSICQISFDNGRNIADGGNDSPPREEAAANGKLIAAAKNALPAIFAALDEAARLHERVERSGFNAGLDHIANFINALDSSEMTGRDVRSAIYSECLTARPRASLSSPVKES